MLQIQNNPWLGLASYQVQDADLFFGREKEMSVLCDIIKQNYSTVIYGKSGMGKTSLINAGLIPQLMADGFLPVSIKLEHNGKRSYADQIIGAVVAKLDEQGCEMESVQQLDAILPDECKLWAFFHTNIFWSKDNHRVVPVVFIDQFEEIFTICEDKAVVQDFFTLLNDLFQVLPPDEALRQIEEKGIRIDFNESTNFRLILSLREDFLARLEDYSYNIPVLRKNRVGVSPLNGLQGLDVILKPISGIMNREAALKILEKVSKCTHIEDEEEALANLSIETCILSLFCSQLYKKAVELKKDMITSELIEQFGDNIINDYYHECMRKISKDSVAFLEDRLLTSSGFRNSLAYEDVVPRYVLKEEIEHLEKCRLIRIEILNKTERIEFTHDVLCGVALEHKTQRRLSKERRGKVSTVLGCVVEMAMMLYFLFVLFFGVSEKPLGFFLLFGEGFWSYILGAATLLGISMLMRMVVYATNRRSTLYSVLSFVLANVGGVLFVFALFEKHIYYDKSLLIPWWLFFMLYTLVVFVLSLTKPRRSSFGRLLLSAFLVKDVDKTTWVALKVFVVLCYLLFVLVSGIYMRRSLTVAMMVGLVPVLLLAISIWKKELLTNKRVWVAGLVVVAFLLCLYFTQYTHFRLYTYLSAGLLLMATYWGMGYIAAFKHKVLRVAWSVLVWAVCFVGMPVAIAGYNLWNLGNYVFVEDGSIASIRHKLWNKYIILETADGKQGAFDRELHTLIPAQYEYVYTGAECERKYSYAGTWVASDIRFVVKGHGLALTSEYLQYENHFTKQLLRFYSALAQTDVREVIRESLKDLPQKSDIDYSDSTATFSSLAENGAIRLEELYESGELADMLDPDIYCAMARYYHDKDAVDLEALMLSKALHCSIAIDSTARFLSKGRWASYKKEALSTLASSAIYVETGHLYSRYVERYDSCFLADKPYQQFVKTFVVDVDAQTFLSAVVDSGLYDADVNNVVSTRRELTSLRNPYFNKYVKRVYERMGNWVSTSFALLFMGEYEAAKEAALEGMKDSSNRVLAATNLLSAHLFLGEYEDAYRVLDTYRDTVLFNGAFKFYRDWVLQDFKDFEREGIVRDIPRKEYLRFKRQLDPTGDRNYGTLAKCRDYDVYWAAKSPETTLWFWWFPFGLDAEGTVFLMDKHGERLTPDFDDVYVANWEYNYVTDEWNFDPIVIYSTGGKRGYYDMSALNYLTEAVYDHAWIFSEGLAAVAKDGLVGFINEAGETVIPFRYDYVPGYDYVFKDGFARIYSREGKAGLIDRQGQIVVPVEYDNIGDWQKEGYRIVRIGSEEYVMDRAGKIM